MKIEPFFSFRYLMILSLFFISGLHAVAFGIVQYPSNFLTSNIPENFHLGLLAILYGSVIVTAILSQILTRSLGLKRVLMLGLFLYFLGLLLFFIPQWILGDFLFTYTFLSLGMLFLGIAFSTVFIGLVTYLILEVPRHLGTAVIILFAFMNLGAMLSSIFLNIFSSGRSESGFLGVMEGLILLSILFIYKYFFNPVFPQHLLHLRKGTRLWKEMHYRLLLYIAVIILYGFCENTFNLWGGKFMGFFLEERLVNNAISVFWLFMIVGQILMLIPLYFVSARNVFYFLVFLIILALFSFPFQTNLGGFIAMLVLGGTACSACFPILLAMMEEEIKEMRGSVDSRLKILPYLEMAIAWMIIGYIIGTGTITFRVEMKSDITEAVATHNFFGAIVYAVLMLLITYYLSLTFHKKSKQKFIGTGDF